MTRPPTAKDTAHASDVMDLRRGLLEAPAVQQRFEELAAMHPDVAAFTIQERFDRLATGSYKVVPVSEAYATAAIVYWNAVGELARDLADASWTGDEIAAIAEHWHSPMAERRRAAGIAPVAASVSFAAGHREGRGRRTTQDRIKRAVLAIAMRAAGTPAIEADEKVAQTQGYGPPAATGRRRQTVTHDRHHLRHRLG